MNATHGGMNPQDGLDVIAAELDALAGVPDDVLAGVVTRDGSCMDLYKAQQKPHWSGEDLTDRQAAARICAGCPVQRHCLELVLRTSGPATLGVWGALPAEAVRELYPLWRSRRSAAGPDTWGGERA
jgi:WhiB family redox-sensing transcriptional regulator